MAIEFNLPKNSSSIIKVVGVGGGGSNAVNHMFRQGIEGVDFMICNTDQQALDASPVAHKIQLGASLTEGLGAGSVPDRGKNAAIETIEEIREVLATNTKMVFITAGMGGGTGTGAAPIIAQAARELDILTVGIVTVPFFFEGRKRRQQAEAGIKEIREHVDTLLIINNDKLREMYGNLKMREAFAKADNVLTTAAKGIAEIITRTGHVNVDFEDVRTVMNDGGAAIMGSAVADGEQRSIKAVEQALSSPLLNDNHIEGARFVLLNMEFGNEEVTMDEISDITDYIQEEAGLTADIIWGYGQDESLEDQLRVTIIATGFESAPVDEAATAAKSKTKPSKVVHELESSQPVNPSVGTRSQNTQASNSEEPYIKNEAKEEEEENPQSTIQFDLSPKPAPKPEPRVDADEPYLKSSEATPTPPSAPKQPEIPSEPVPTPEASAPQNRSTSMEEHKKRAEERIRTLHNLRNNLGSGNALQALESEPAYRRKQITLNDTPHSSESQVSRFSLGDETDENGDKRTGLRGNNSFLHDNVD